ncbi:hypothetical protein [Thiococcus pfennigii]|uniref:phage tail tube protein n=1 Tax=Thiococcus pfennigii TaxID=1057 RepID=UPI001903A6E2|nr:hypothetical protein [Thiococcus pfennigii]MBK1699737.1 hypothetical protein [Thiococcus pfennigii]
MGIHENEFIRFSADVYAFPIVDGVEQPGLGPFISVVASMNPQSERYPIVDKRRNRRGQVAAATNDPQPMEGAWTVRNGSPLMLAKLLFGTLTDVTDSGSTVAGEAVTAKVDQWVQLAHGNLSSVVVTDGDTTTYVAGTDYEIEDKLGMIRALSGGAIGDDDQLEIDYTYSGVTRERIKVGTEVTQRVRLYSRLDNDVDGTSWEYEAYSVLLTPTEAFDLGSDEPIDLQFNLYFETPSDKDHPVRFDRVVYASPT